MSEVDLNGKLQVLVDDIWKDCSKGVYSDKHKTLCVIYEDSQMIVVPIEGRIRNKPESKTGGKLLREVLDTSFDDMANDEMMANKLFEKAEKAGLIKIL